MSTHKTNRFCHSETEIRNLFERHMKTLLNQKETMINEITEWEINLMRQIKQNVEKQKHFLEQEFKNKCDSIRSKCKEYLDEALYYEEMQNREQIRLLIENCHEVKLKLNSFDYPERLIPFIQVQTEKISTSISNDNSKIVHDQNTNLSRRSNSEQNNQASSARSPFIGNSRISTDNTDMFPKCPTCFVIFSSNMTIEERTKHVNQHFEDS